MVKEKFVNANEAKQLLDELGIKIDKFLDISEFAKLFSHELFKNQAYMFCALCNGEIYYLGEMSGWLFKNWTRQTPSCLNKDAIVKIYKELLNEKFMSTGGLA